MTLNDLRRLAVKQRLRIRFAISEGRECVVNEHGVAEVPGLRAAGIRLDEELERAAAFTVVDAANAKERPLALARAAMEARAAQAAPGTAVRHDAEE